MKTKRAYHNRRKLICKTCGNSNFYKEKRKGCIHIGVFCTQCQRWLKWDSQRNDCHDCNFGKTCKFKPGADDIKDINVRCDRYNF